MPTTDPQLVLARFVVQALCSHTERHFRDQFNPNPNRENLEHAEIEHAEMVASFFADVRREIRHFIKGVELATDAEISIETVLGEDMPLVLRPAEGEA